jgi:hypothetical protein
MADWESGELMGANGRRRVVITGLGAVTPLASDVATSWERLIGGRSAAGPITAFDPREFMVRFACEAKDFDPTMSGKTQQLSEPLRSCFTELMGDIFTLDHATIYGLFEIRDGLIRYVGRTNQWAEDRLGSHVRQSRQTPNRPVCAWIKSIGEENVGIVVIEHPLMNEQYDAEERIITGLRTLGQPLLNVS